MYKIVLENCISIDNQFVSYLSLKMKVFRYFYSCTLIIYISNKLLRPWISSSVSGVAGLELQSNTFVCNNLSNTFKFI